MTDAPIRIRPASRPHAVRAGGAVLAESGLAMIVEVDGAEPAVYLPLDADSALFLEATDVTETVRDIGEVRILRIIAKSGPIERAAWTVERPAPGAEALEGLTSFDAERVAVEAL